MSILVSSFSTMSLALKLLLVFISLLALWSIGQIIYLNNIESTKYEVVIKNNEYEIRNYPSYIIAKTNIKEGSMNSGFGTVAGYIFGGNVSKKSDVSEPIAMTTPVLSKKSEKIAMTTPVLTNNTNNYDETLAFILPSKYTLETLPTPTNENVKLEKVPANKWAVLRYTWRSNAVREQKKLEQLLNLLRKDGILYTNEVQFAYYNPPLTLPFLLRNEVWVKLK